MNRLWNALAGGLRSLSQIESDIVNEGGSGVEERRQHAHFGIEGIDCRTTIRRINVISGVQLATGVESKPRDLRRVRSVPSKSAIFVAVTLARSMLYSDIMLAPYISPA